MTRTKTSEEKRQLRLERRRARAKIQYRMRKELHFDFDYKEMLESQNGRCLICLLPPPKGERLHLDHDHESGKMRSLICGSCNRGLGLFQDSPTLLKNAFKYLQLHGKPDKLRHRRWRQKRS